MSQRAYSSTPKKRPLSQCSSFSNPHPFDFASSGGTTTYSNNSNNTKVQHQSPSSKRQSPGNRTNNEFNSYSGDNSDNNNNSSNSSNNSNSSNTNDHKEDCQNNHNNDTTCTDDDDDDDDGFKLSQILEMAPEFDGITKGIEQLSINEEVVEEIGDELQEKAIGLAAEGKNIFLTGKAGTGKSWTTRKIVDACRSSADGKKKVIHVTAPTGIAAINVNGRTIHSWGGFGLGEYYTDFGRMMDKEIMKKIRDTDTLLIDEISMIDGHFFDVLECMISIIRCYDMLDERIKDIKKIGNTISEDAGGTTQNSPNSIMSPYMLEMRRTWGDIEPWGGMQLIVVGDFFQLPPIPNSSRNIGSRGGNVGVLLENDELSETEYNLKIGRQGCYAFESHTWHRSDLQIVELQKVHRQAENDGLFELLNAMRAGEANLIYTHQAALSALRAPIQERNDGIIPTELHSTNRNVDQVNRSQLERLPGDPHTLNSLDEVVFGQKYKSKLLKKYKLELVSHMPYLFASVEEPPPPPPLLREIRDKLVSLEEKRKILIANEDYETLITMKPEIKGLKEKIETLEKEEKEKSDISFTSIKKFLDVRGIKNEDPSTVFQNYQGFVAQLKNDFEALKEHADRRFFQKDCRVNEIITLKEQAQVMLLWNLDVPGQLANGSRGILKGFVPTASYRRLIDREIKKRQNDEENRTNNGSVEQTGSVVSEKCQCHIESGVVSCTCTAANDPIKCVHEKSEDVKKDKEETEAVDDYNYSIDPEILQEIKASIEYMSDLNDELRIIDKISMSEMMTALPYVQFTNGKKRLICPQPFKKEFKGCGRASRWQIPLTLAWAISIHKSQGMTIDLLHVDLKGCFAPGQAYVACSRGRSLKSMTVVNFDPNEIKTSKKVQKFYKSLNTDAPYSQTWSDTIAEFDKYQKDKHQLKKRMEEQYMNEVCREPTCFAPCVVNQAKKNGRWFIACSAVYGHFFQWVPVTPH
jgi:hypothetical protein